MIGIGKSGKKIGTLLVPPDEVDKGLVPKEDDATRFERALKFEPKLKIHDDDETGYAVYIGVIGGAVKCGIRFNGAIPGPGQNEPARKGEEFQGFPYVADPSVGGLDARWFILPDWLTHATMEAALKRKSEIDRRPSV